MEMEKRMVHNQNVPQPYWEKVVNAVVYILNKTRKILQDITPEDSWLGRKPFVRDFSYFQLYCFCKYPQGKTFLMNNWMFL